MIHPAPLRPRTLEQKILDVILQYRSLMAESQDVHDQGQMTGITEEVSATEYDLAELLQMMEGRLYRLRGRIMLYKKKIAANAKDLEELLADLPKPQP